MRSVYDGVKVAKAVLPFNLTGTGTPTALRVQAVDTFGYNSLIFNVAVGTMTGTTTVTTFTLDAQVVECATSGGTYTNVSGATITQMTTFDQMAQIRVEGLGTPRARYMKIMLLGVVTPATQAQVPVSAVAILGRAFKVPVDNSSTGA